MRYIMKVVFVFCLITSASILFAGKGYVGNELPPDWLILKNLIKVASCKDHKIIGKRWDESCKCYIVHFSCDYKHSDGQYYNDNKQRARLHKLDTGYWEICFVGAGGETACVIIE
ncbi:MAG: hypothetical protein GY749_44820 [Desulfobacteraceae bacterium]|nr:hypothetical protein [Desulfobacteraceae bacterium]